MLSHTICTALSVLYWYLYIMSAHQPPPPFEPMLGTLPIGHFMRLLYKIYIPAPSSSRILTAAVWFFSTAIWRGVFPIRLLWLMLQFLVSQWISDLLCRIRKFWQGLIIDAANMNLSAMWEISAWAMRYKESNCIRQSQVQFIPLMCSRNYFSKNLCVYTCSSYIIL